MVAGNASAGVFVGNPTTKVQLEYSSALLVSGLATLEKITMEYCDGTEVDHDFDAEIDPVEGVEFQAGTGEVCHLTAHWSSNIEATAVAGLFTIESWDLTTTVALSGATQSASLSGWSVVAGTAPQGAPELVVTFD